MPGLTNPMPQAPAAAPAQPPVAASPAPAAAPAPGGAAPAQPQASPNQGKPIGDGPVDQELYKKYVANCMNTVTGSLQAIGKMIGEAQDKPGALAQATVQAIIRVEDSLEQNGGTLNLSMTFNGGAECMTDIVDAMEKMGVYQFQQKEIDAAFLRAVNTYRTIRQQQGRIDQAMMQQKLMELKQQEQQGTLDQQYPGLTQFAKDGKKALKPSYKPGGAAPQQAQPDQQQDAEDQEDGGDDEEAEGEAPAQGSQDFPADVLNKRKPNSIAVKPHFRNQPKKRKAPKPVKPAAAPVKPGKKGMV